MPVIELTQALYVCIFMALVGLTIFQAMLSN